MKAQRETSVFYHSIQILNEMKLLEKEALKENPRLNLPILWKMYDMWIRDETTGVFRLATRNEAESAMGDLPEGSRRRGVWIRDEVTGVFRPATRNEAAACYGGMPHNIAESPRDICHRRRRHRRRGREHRHRPSRDYSDTDLMMQFMMVRTNTMDFW